MITDKSLERAYNEKLDAHSRVNEPDDTFECESCGQEFDESEQCDHDGYTEHQWCQGCCEDAEPEEKRSYMEWNDLD